MARGLYVYILAGRGPALYVGVTNDLRRRVREHRTAPPWTHTGRYRIDRLVYHEVVAPPMAAIRREKQPRGWVRRRKAALVESVNPAWRDLAAEWR